MPLDNLDNSPGADKWGAQGYPKLNAAINKINEIDEKIIDGSASQILRKIDGSDYNYEWSDEQDISGKYNSSSIIFDYGSAAGPTNYSTETTVLSSTPSADKSSSQMKFTFSGYFTNGANTDATTIRIKKNGIERTITKQASTSAAQQNVCIVFVDSYAAADVITVTAQSVSVQSLSSYSLLCEALDAI